MITMKKIYKLIKLSIKRIVLAFLYFYKKAISPFLPGACRFQPTCSEYMIEAIKLHGTIKGIWLGVKRICKCHPWGESGYDPVCKPTNKTTD